MSKSDFAQAAAGKRLAKAKDTTTVSIRMTLEERSRLETLAGDRPISAFVRSRVFGKNGSRKSVPRRSTADSVALAIALGALGRSDLSERLNAIASAADNGRLHLDEDTRSLICQACEDIAKMRFDLVSALGLDAR